MSYTTKQQQAILTCLKRRQGQPLSAADLAAELRRDGSPVGLATIYRQLERLESAGCIHKISTDEGSYFQYCTHAENGGGCLLLKCERCGRILHLDCSYLQPLYEHLEQEHHFTVDRRRMLFTGLCADCRAKEEQHEDE